MQLAELGGRFHLPVIYQSFHRVPCKLLQKIIEGGEITHSKHAPSGAKPASCICPRSA